jgi:transposase
LTSFPETLARTELGRKQVLGVEDWAEIRRLRRAEGLSISEIARVLGISRNTVKAALASDAPPRYQRRRAGSVVAEFEPRIRELLAAYPRMPATVIGERIGWGYSIRTLSGRVAQLRPMYLPPDPASRTVYVAGEIAQCDFWFSDIALPVGFGQVRTATQLPVLTMVTGYARWSSAVLVPTRRAEDLYAGWWQLIEGLGVTPRVLVWDGGARSGGGVPSKVSSPGNVKASGEPWPPRWLSAGQRTRRPRAWSSGCTTIWNARFYRVGSSALPRTSTPSWWDFWLGLTPATTGLGGVRPLIGSRPTRPPCCRCHRWRRWWAGDAQPGYRAIMTCG